jgi:predicted TIM-barrel fold metal-dependent hydrolase
VHFHAFPVMARGVLENAGPLRPNATYVAQSLFQVNLFNIFAGLVAGTVFERYPNFRCAFAESGIGWIPYALDRMDLLWEEHAQFRNIGLKKKPSEYWRQQCKASFQYERVGSKLVDLIGAETLMWGSDFPHGDGVWPESDKYISEQFGHLPAEQVRMITCDNAVEFYRLAS